MIRELINQANTVILGKEHQIKLSICCLLAQGHLLIEDLPGMGKTTLSHLIAQLFGLNYTRIQFTSDMLPADIIGVSIFNKETHDFKFIKGPIFTQVVLADEINRSSARTQSALLEAMEENQVSIDKHTYPLDKPFFVIATQNPNFQMGTFPLPESQLDRFLMRITLGYPEPAVERLILQGRQDKLINSLSPFFNNNELLNLQNKVSKVFVSDAILDIIQEILRISREQSQFITGLSPRAGLALIQASKAWALLHEREMVIPDDIDNILTAVIGHRLQNSSLQSLSDEEIRNVFQQVQMV
ncbi:MAG: AAA family ATPase [Gammaproteobacteria bacterium]|nr:AAA family ATPase [Gammaproteobacteria bacterium]